MRLSSSIMLLALATSSAACAGSSTAAPPPATPTPAPTPDTTDLPGGYRAQDVNDAEIRAEAEQAITLLRQRQNAPGLSMTALRSAATQVVAGLNFRFVFDVSTAGGPRQVQVVMYRNLQQERSLTEVNGL